MRDIPHMGKVSKDIAERNRAALRKFMKEHGLQQRPWALKAEVAVRSIGNFLNKHSQSLDHTTLQALAAAVGVSTEDIIPTIRGNSKPQGVDSAVDNSQREVAPQNQSGVTFAQGTVAERPKDLKVLGYVKAGTVGYFPDNGETLDMTHRPPALQGVLSAYAVFVHDDSMIPAFEPGWVVWVHPKRAAKPGDNVIIQLRDGQAFIKRLVRRTEKFLICKQWNPTEEVKYDSAKVKDVHLVVGSGIDP